MSRFRGPGPVLLCEAMTASRRWQGYALRAFLILALLVALWIAWFTLTRNPGWTTTTGMNRYMAELGEHSYYGVAGVLLTLVLLVAPAATAGAVCVDRDRGWLAHMFVTELTDPEIILGKLVARFASVVALVIAVVPLLAISTLLGGIIPEAIVSLTVTTLAVGLMGCSLALALSVRAARTHEVLMLVFALWAIWLLSYPIWLGAAGSGVVATAPDWFAKLNPFVLVYAPYVKPGYIVVVDLALLVTVALLISIGAVLFAIRTLRNDLKPHGARSERVETARRWIKARLFSWWPTPTLDGNPVLWREWHRNRPSRMARLVSALFIGCTALGMSIGIYDNVRHGRGSNENLLVVIDYIAVTFGLLLLSATSPTSLTEERVRGSLDILMTTPLSTRAIVMGKWWAAYRRTLPILLVPALSGLFVAATCLDYPTWLPARMLQTAKPVRTIDRVLAGTMPTAFFLVHAAAVTSFGLTLATWLKRTGVAVAVSVSAFVVISIGLIPLVESVLRSLLNWRALQSGRPTNDQINALLESLLALSPLGGQVIPFQMLSNVWNNERDLSWKFLLIELAFVAVVAVVFLGLTLLTFNRCMGRMNESPELRRYLRTARRASQRRRMAVACAEAARPS
jgi:ABC-type transport system involved in multi-copper enzyme maturation permease subunit